MAARKAAEQLIYGEYLDQNAGWEEDLKEAIEKLKKNKSPPLCLQSTPRGTQGFGKAGMPLPRLTVIRTACAGRFLPAFFSFL